MKRPILKLFLGVLSLAVMGYALPPITWADGPKGTSEEEREYGQREAQARELEEFEGGYHGVVVAFFLLLIVVSAIHIMAVDSQCYCEEHHIYHHHHYPEPSRPIP